MADNREKLAGILRLDLSKLQQDITQANVYLQNIGKNIAPQLSSQIEKAIKDGIQNGVKNATVPKLQTNNNKGNTNSSAYTETIKALREESSLLTKIQAIRKDLLTAEGNRRNELQEALRLLGDELGKAQTRHTTQRALVTDQTELNRIETQENILLAQSHKHTSDRLKVAERLTDQQQKQTIAARTYAQIQQAIVSTFTTMAVQATVGSLKQFWSDAWEYATQYYDRMNEIRIVTLKTQEDADKLSDNFRKMAREMSVSSNEIADAAMIFYRQGLDDSEVEQRMQATIQYAKTAGVASEDAANKITAVVNSINKDARGVEMTAQRVADVFLYLGKRYCPIAA